MTGRQLSAADLDHPSTLPQELQEELAGPLPDGPGPHVWTTDGWLPYVAEEPAPIESPEATPSNPLNPKGEPSLSLPQQTTPLTSEQGVISNEDLADRPRLDALMAEDGPIPDNPYNPKGTPDFFLEEAVTPMDQPPPQSPEQPDVR